MFNNIVKEIAEKVVSVEDKVKEELEKPVNEQLKNYLRKEKLIITFSSSKKVPASILYWTLAAFKMHQYPPILAPYSSFITHIAPYHEQYSVIALVDNVYLLKPIFDFRKLLRIDTFVLTENIPKQMKTFDVAEISFKGDVFEKTLFWALYLSITALKSLAKEVQTRRVSNLLKELANVGEIVEDMCKQYKNTIEELAEVLKHGSILHVYAPEYLLGTISLLFSGRKHITLHDITSIYFEELPKDGKIIIFRTGVEEHIGRYVKIRLSIKGVHDVSINVDPVSAPIYLLILLESALKLSEHM